MSNRLMTIEEYEGRRDVLLEEIQKTLANPQEKNNITDAFWFRRRLVELGWETKDLMGWEGWGEEKPGYIIWFSRWSSPDGKTAHDKAVFYHSVHDTKNVAECILQAAFKALSQYRYETTR